MVGEGLELQTSQNATGLKGRLICKDQQTPWRYPEDGHTVTRGSAWSGPGCHLGCGVLIHSQDGKVLKVEGDPDNPYNQGRLCPRCLALTDIANNENRLRYPMKRAARNRGKNLWERITWEEAFDTIETTFNQYKAEFGAESVVFIQGTGRDIAAYISRLAWSFGSPNYCFSLSNISCYGPRIFASTVTLGTFMVGDYSQQFIDRYDNPHWRVPGIIVIWGNNPLVANSDGAYGHWVVDCMRRGSKTLVVDPRCTWSAAHADLWLQVRPGTDCALALGIAHVLIKDGLCDDDFIEKWTFGFEVFEEEITRYTPEYVSDITWVSAEDIRAAAHLLADNAPALLQWGVALDQREDCVDGGRAVLDLMVLTGNIEKPGSNVQPAELLKYITGWGQELLPKEQVEKKIGSHLPVYKMGIAAASINEIIPAMLEQRDSYPIKASWIQTVNEIACGGVDIPDTIKAFNNLEFNVVVDMFMTPTIMAFGDLVLPTTVYPERNGIRCGDGHQRAETLNRAIEPLDECKSDQEINWELGRRFNPEAWPWASVEEMYSFILKETGLSFEQVQDCAPAYLPFEYERHQSGKLRPDGAPGFPTPTGRIELYSNAYAFMGYNPIPHYVEPPMTPLSQPDLFKEYPLVLTTGARRHNTFHSENRQSPHLRAMHPEPTVQIHPQTAADIGLTGGEWVWVEGPVGLTGKVGRAKRRVEITPIVDPRVASTDHAWWHPEGDPENLYDVQELNINNLISWSSGTTGVGANYKCILCKIYRVKGE